MTTNRIIDFPADPDLRSVLSHQIESLKLQVESGDSYALGQLDMAKAVQAMLKNLAIPVVKAKAAKPVNWQAEARKAANDFVRAKTAEDRAKATVRLNNAHAEIAKAKAGHVSENGGAVGCAAVAAPVAAPKAPASGELAETNAWRRSAGLKPMTQSELDANKARIAARQAVKA